MLQQIIYFLKKIFQHKRASTLKNKYQWRRQSSVKRYQKLQEIVGKSEGETFARRMAYLRRIDPLIFEELVLDAYERQGYKVIRNRRYSGDGGIDGRVIINNQTIGIQCKRYKSFIRKEHVELFRRDLAKNQLQRGFFIHTGKTPKTVNFASKEVSLISGERLLKLLIE